MVYKFQEIFSCLFSNVFFSLLFRRLLNKFFMFCSLGYKNRKSCKILPKFLPTLHFLQESYKIVQEPQILQICYNVEYFLQEITFLQKLHFFRNEFLQKCDVLFRPKIQKSLNYQHQQPHLPLTMHRLPQGPSKTVKMVNFDQEEFTCNLTPKVTKPYSGNPQPTNNALIYLAFN